MTFGGVVQRLVGQKAAYSWALALILGFTVLDFSLPHNSIAEPLYAIPVVVAYRTYNSRFVIGIISLAIILSLLAIAFSPNHDPRWSVALSHFLAIGVVLGVGTFAVALQRVESKLRKELKIQRILTRVGQTITQSNSLDKQLPNVSALLSEIIGHDYLAVASLSREKEILIDNYVATDQVGDRVRLLESLNEDSGLENLVLRRIPIVRNGTESRRVGRISVSEKVCLQIGLKSLIAVPLVSLSEVVGILIFRSRNENAYGSEGLNLALRISVLLSGMVANTQSRRKVEETHEQLEQSEENYRDLVESSHDLIWRCDAEGRFSYLNPAWERTHGYTADEMLGRPFTDFETEEIAERDKREFGRHLAGGSVIDYETHQITKSGERLTLLFNAFPVTNVDGEIIGTRGTARDVTAERKAQEKLIASEVKYRDLYDNAPDMYISVDAVTGNIIDCNRTVHISLGYLRDELIGKSVFDLYHPDSLAESIDLFRQFQETGMISDAELSLLRKNGTTLDVSLGVSAVRDAEGNIVRSRGIMRDITERKRAEEELRIRVAALDTAADMVVITEPQGTIEYVNRAFTEVTGYEPEEVVGGSPRILKSGRQDPAFYCDLWDTIMAGKVWSGTLINRRKDGSEYPEEMTITPVIGDAGKILRFIAIKRDISARLRITAERESARDLEAENRELVRLEEARSEFLSLISHELRTPLTSLLAFGDILAKNRGGTMTSKQLGQLDLMRSSGWKLDGLINDLLDMSRSEAGTFKIEKQEFELTRAVKQMASLTKSIFEQKHQSLCVEIEDEPVWVDGDEIRISQVISNLLTNASKYSSEQDDITVRLSGATGGINIDVIDQGFGISKVDVARLFTPFFRVDNEQTRKEGGTGLGLVIAKTIVDLHGGEISVKSTPGKGTTMRVFLPTISSKNSTGDDSVNGFHSTSFEAAS